MNYQIWNVRIHTLDLVCKRTAVTRIRNAVLNADVPRYQLWGI